MCQRHRLSFDLTWDQWAAVNNAMLACFARTPKPRPDGAARDDPAQVVRARGDPVNEALATICREWLAAEVHRPHRS